MELPYSVERIITRLENAGFEAYAVGGCVRDSLLGRIPEDWDITTSASPEEIKRLFSHTIDTGIEHGTVTVMLDHVGYEVTTYRLDGVYEDHRHPKEVTFTKELAEDLRRRDFTINAMAYNTQKGLVDLYQGAEDLERGTIRCVGEPKERFGEDALRIFRAVRFSAQLGFTIEEKTLEAMKELAGDLTKVSAERIRTELVKLLLSDHPDRLVTAYETGITAVCLPEFDRMMETEQRNPHHCYDVGRHTIKSLEALHGFPEYKTSDKKTQSILNLTMLLHDSAKPECEAVDNRGMSHFYGHQTKGAWLAGDILRRLKLDNDTIYAVTRLIRFHDSRFQIDIKDVMPSVRKLVNKVGTELMEPLFVVQKADIAAQAPAFYADAMKRMELLTSCYQEILVKGQCVSLKTLAVTGQDLLTLGYEPGPQLGDTLRALLSEVINSPEKNTKEKLIEIAGQYKKQGWIPVVKE